MGVFNDESFVNMYSTHVCVCDNVEMFSPNCFILLGDIYFLCTEQRYFVSGRNLH